MYIENNVKGLVYTEEEKIIIYMFENLSFNDKLDIIRELFIRYDNETYFENKITMVTFDSKLNGFDIANNILINNKYITLGSCKKYSPNENSNIVYASLRVYNDLYNKNKGLFLLGKKVYIKGYLNSYSDKDIKIHNYVTVTRIEGYDFESATGPVIGVDYDGVGTWNGKRMEDTPATPEEQEEMDRMIRDIVGDDYE